MQDIRQYNVSIVFYLIDKELLDKMLFKVIDEFEIKGDVLVMTESERTDETVKVLDKIAENWYFVLFCD